MRSFAGLVREVLHASNAPAPSRRAFLLGSCGNGSRSGRDWGTGALCSKGLGSAGMYRAAPWRSSAGPMLQALPVRNGGRDLRKDGISAGGREHGRWCPGCILCAVQQGTRRKERRAGKPGIQKLHVQREQRMSESGLWAVRSPGNPGTFPVLARKVYWCTILQAVVEDMSCVNVCTVCLSVHASKEVMGTDGNVSCLIQGKMCASNGRCFSNGAQFLAGSPFTFLSCCNY